MYRCLSYIVAVLILGILQACHGTRKSSSSGSRPPSFHEQRRLAYEHPALDPEKPVKPKLRGVSSPTVSSRKNQLLYDFIEDWRGTPHRMGGNTQKGVDCSGFVIRIYDEIYQNPFRGRRAEDLFMETTPVNLEDLEEGDLVFFKIHGRRIDHVGIYLSEGRFAHVSSSRGVMVSRLDQAYFKKRFFRGGRRQ